MILGFIIKCCLCQLAFIGVYLFLRKDKRFVFNRYYLLLSLIGSLIIPTLKFTVPDPSTYLDQSHLNLVTKGISSFQKSSLNLIQNQNFYRETPRWSLSHILLIIYALGVSIMAIRYIRNLRSIQRLIKQSEKLIVDTTLLILVPFKTDPFCFGKFIFVNRKDYYQNLIDPEIIRHENAHVKTNHTMDVLVAEFILIFYWFNPFVWIYRFLIKANHEFYADHQVLLSGTPIERYSEQLIRFLNRPSSSLPVSGFNYFLIKNRIIMMSTQKSSNLKFANKLILSAILLLIGVAAFSFINKPTSELAISDPTNFTVVIDPGHGGFDEGAKNQHQGILEKNLVLDISKEIENQLSDSRVNILLTRSTDVNKTLSERTDLANAKGANLFVSLHINNNENTSQRGMEIYYSELNSKSNLSQKYCQLFAKSLDQSGNYPLVKTADFTVLKGVDCAAVLLELGFISNNQDLELLSNKNSQQNLAKKLAASILEISSLE